VHGFSPATPRARLLPWYTPGHCPTRRGRGMPARYPDIPCRRRGRGGGPERSAWRFPAGRRRRVVSASPRPGAIAVRCAPREAAPPRV